MLVAYSRVSTKKQKLDLQRDALKQAGCEQFFSDVASGAKTDRPGLDEALAFMRSGDCLVCWRLDRVGRSMPHLVGLVADLQERGIGFRSLTESIDTTSASGKLIFGIFASLAEFERELIRERTRAGLEAARARGRRGGRKPKMNARKIEAARALHREGKMSIADICEQLGISRTTFYRYLND